MGTEALENNIDRGLNKQGDIQYGEVGSNVRRSIAEDYANARLDIHVHIEFATEKYCALLNRDIEIMPTGGTTIEEPGYTKDTTERTPCEQQVSMLIRIIQAMKVPEPLPVVVWPRTIARLKRIDDADYCTRHPLELAPLFSLVTGGVVKDGELISLGRVIPLRQDKLPNKIVEGTSVVVEHLSDDDIDPLGHGRHILEAADLLSRVIIDIADNDIGFEVLDGQQVPFERLDVLSGPGILNQRSIEGSHGKTLRKPKYSENPQESRDSCSNTGRVRDELGQGGEADEGITASPPEEELAQTSPDHRLGGYTAKHTRSGSLEDA